MALAMSPMTAAIMSAVPARRAGAGSAMNDATRELGAALGVAVLGSIAASQYSSHLHHALGALPGVVEGSRKRLDRRGTARRRSAHRPCRDGTRARGAQSPSWTASTLPRSSASSWRDRGDRDHAASCPARSATKPRCTRRSTRSKKSSSSAWAASPRCSPTTATRGLAVTSRDPASPSPTLGVVTVDEPQHRAVRSAHPRELRHRRHHGVR